MAKVETFIEVTLKMNLVEARSLRDEMGGQPAGNKVTYAIFDALDEALKEVQGVE